MNLVLAVIKILDNIILTIKSITTYQSRKILSSFLTVVSQLIFYTIIEKVVADSSLRTVWIVSLSSGVGTYLAFIISDRFQKDDKWQFVLSCNDMQDVKKLCVFLKENSIRYIANYGLTKEGKDTINVIAFSKTKSESRRIESYLAATSSKYLKEIMK